MTNVKKYGIIPYVVDKYADVAEPDVSRIRKMFRIQILIKAEQGLSLSKLKAFLKQKCGELVKAPVGKGVRIYFDVDPL